MPVMIFLVSRYNFVVAISCRYYAGDFAGETG